MVTRLETAETTRAKTKKALESVEDINKVADAINKAAEEGRLMVEVPYRINWGIKKMLEEYGYEVSEPYGFMSEEGYGVYTLIRWDNNL